MWYLAGGRELLPGRRKEAAEARIRMVAGRHCPVDPLPGKKPFVKANPEIPTIPDYGLEDYGEEYWSCWPAAKKNNNSPWLVYSQVRDIWDKTGCVTQEECEQLLSDIKYGVNTGCVGDARKPTARPNNPSAAVHGERLLDVMATWVKEGIISGPFTLEEVNSEFPNGFTVNPIQCAEKPCGKVIATLRLAALHQVDVFLRFGL